MNLPACAHVLDTLAEEHADPVAFCIIYPRRPWILPDDLIPIRRDGWMARPKRMFVMAVGGIPDPPLQGAEGIAERIP